MTTLRITTSWMKGSHDYMDTFGSPRVIRPPKIEIEVKFELLDGFRRMSRQMVWKMEAYEDYDEPTLRRQFLQSTYWEFYVWSDGQADPNNITSVEVYDTPDLLKWLAPGQDLKDFFISQNTKQINAQPLRIAPPHS